MEVTELWVYPVKSMAGSSLQEAILEGRGFKDDRRWMLIDENGRFISQREYPFLMFWKATVIENALLLEQTSTGESIRIENAKPMTGTMVDVEVWGAYFKACLVDIPKLDAFQKMLGFPCRLVYLAKENHRAIDQKYAKPGEEVSFADGYPYLIINTASLQVLSNKIGRELKMKRFRPNIVIKTDEPFTEDNWTSVTIGGHQFRIPKPCARCIIITIDPETSKKDARILGELASFRKVGRKVLFGTNGIWEGEEQEQATLKIGDELQVD